MIRPALALLVVGCGGCGRMHFDPLDDASVDGARLTYRDAVLQDAPLTYWRLDDDDATARDEMSLFDGSYSTGCTSVPGVLVDDPDAAMHFDGVSCHVTFAGHLDFSGTAPFSIELWVSAEALGSFATFFMDEERIGPQPQNGFAMLDGNSPSTSYFERVGAGTNHLTSPRYPAQVGQLVYFVGTYDGTELRLYANGVVVSSGAATNASDMSRAAMAIGSYPAPGGNYVHGTLDEVAAYDHALAPDRIALHYLIGTQGPQPLP